MPSSESRPATSPQVMPYLYYPDATAALDFLMEAFGFEEIYAFRDGDGNVLTAQLSTGDGAVMVGPAMEEFGSRAVDDPTQATMRTFVYVDDVDGHCARARAAGALITTEPAEHGPNRIYIATDCGGQQWIFARPVG
jgi:uncharacterized glyoxalase superfamily protein PhnB